MPVAAAGGTSMRGTCDFSIANALLASGTGGGGQIGRHGGDQTL
jgi:hypothetical protein